MEEQKLEQFAAWLRDRERSKNTVEKYVRDARRFLEFAGTVCLGTGTGAFVQGDTCRKNIRLPALIPCWYALNSYLLFIGQAGVFCEYLPGAEVPFSG